MLRYVTYVFTIYEVTLEIEEVYKWILIYLYPYTVMNINYDRYFDKLNIVWIICFE